MINRNSFGYKSGRFVGRLILIGLGYFLGKRFGVKPIEKPFPFLYLYLYL